MKINVYKILPGELSGIHGRILSCGYAQAEQVRGLEGHKKDWSYRLYYKSEHGTANWTATFSDVFAIPSDHKKTKSLSGLFLIWKQETGYAACYGQGNRAVKGLVDTDFGIDLAKRVAHSRDFRLTSTKRYSGRKRGEIRSYKRNTAVRLQPGESIDHVSAGIVGEEIAILGKSGKFGESVLLNPNVGIDEIPGIMERICEILQEEEKLKLPQAKKLSGKKSMAYEKRFAESLANNSDDVSTVDDGYVVNGTSFVFPDEEASYQLQYKDTVGNSTDVLEVKEIATFIKDNSVPNEEVLDAVRVIRTSAEGKTEIHSLRASLEYMDEKDRVIFSGGEWKKFNQDYVRFLDESVDEIDIEKCEKGLETVPYNEQDLFKNEKLLGKLGYRIDQGVFEKAPDGTPIEAWDLFRTDTNTAYAVKSGTAQKLGYVCDQALMALNTIGSRSILKNKRRDIRKYVLWIFLKREKKIKKMSEIKSLIFKQKLESWSRECAELGLKCAIKVSYRKTKKKKMRGVKK